MKKTLIVIISILIGSTALVGCSSNKKASTEATNSSVSELSANAKETDISTLNEDTEKLQHKEKFLKSIEGHDFQVVSCKFTKAYLSGDVSTMKSYLINPENKDNYYNTENMFDDVEFLILKLDPNDIKEDTIIAEYEFCLKNHDYFQYLNLEMKKVNDKWKVEHYGLEM